MSFHNFYNYSLSDDDADCISFLLYEYLKASQSSKFRCRTIKDFMYFLLRTSLQENEVLNLLFEAIYHLPRIDILYECNFKYKDFEDFEFGKYINMKRILLLKLFNAHSEEEFESFATKMYCINDHSGLKKNSFYYLEYLMDKWVDNEEMKRCFEFLNKYYEISAIPDIIDGYNGYDKTKQIEIKIPVEVELENIVVTLEKGDSSCPPSFLIDSKNGPKTIDYDPKSNYSSPDEGFQGVCLIFNICKYKSRERSGADLDVKNIQDTFSNLHFTIEVKKDLTKTKMLDIAESYSRNTHGKMFVCFILAHGENDYILDINEESVSCRELSMKFSAKNCEAYRGKPKVFFIQSYQGKQHQEDVDTETFTVPQEEQDGRSKLRINQYKDNSSTPEEADFFLSIATVDDMNKGSWYIETLCDEIRESASRCHLMDILTNVIYKLSQKQYQPPMICTTLTKKCYLTSMK